jgi:hypothetical protein
MWWWDQLIEEKVREAHDAGGFDNLRGEGKPLRLDDGSYAGENWLGYHLMQEAGVLPDWLEMRKEIIAEREDVRRILQEITERLSWLPLSWWSGDPILARASQRYLERAGRLNDKIEHHNHRCPSIRHELVKVRIDAVERAMQRRRREASVSYTSGERD